ncbi:MAG TPA: SURF1 family protein [Rhizomicrobium sp.]|nr:SURF1 family protein [Rhizomicrobium sp.]
MRIIFRPMLVPTLWSVPLFAILTGLGLWQIHRLHWKLALIAALHANIAAPPIALDRALALGDAAQYHRVELAGEFDHDKEAYVFTTGEHGDPVYHVITPLILANGKAILVDRGYVPPGLRDPGYRAYGQIAGPRHIVGVWRVPDPPGLFTPAPDLKNRIWYARDVNGIAKADGVALAAPVLVEADATPNPGGWPKGGQTVVKLRNDHLQYAITWLALAEALLIMYFAYHRSHGRFSVRLRK